MRRHTTCSLRFTEETINHTASEIWILGGNVWQSLAAWKPQHLLNRISLSYKAGEEFWNYSHTLLGFIYPMFSLCFSLSLQSALVLVASTYPVHDHPYFLTTWFISIVWLIVVIYMACDTQFFLISSIFFYCSKNIYHEIYPFNKSLSVLYNIVKYNINSPFSTSFVARDFRSQDLQ